MDTKTIERFWAKVDRKSTEECWNWTASCFNSRMGYGAFGVGKKVISAHRVSYEIANGPIENGAHVLHKCDNPKCVNPNHLFLGNQQINILDKVSKGRAARKLCLNQVLAIRAAQESQRTIAKQHNISQHMVYRIKHRIAWNHVP